MTGTRGNWPPAPCAGPVDDVHARLDRAREAIIGHWHDGEVRLERLQSDVPPHHRATGHVRHDPTIRHGGGGRRTRGEANRLEHLARFIDPSPPICRRTGSCSILGPGTVRDRLGHRIHETERHSAAPARSTIQTAGRLTEPQLVARLRHLAGAETSAVDAWRAPLDGTPSRRVAGLAARRMSRVSIHHRRSRSTTKPDRGGTA